MGLEGWIESGGKGCEARTCMASSPEVGTGFEWET